MTIKNFKKVLSHKFQGFTIIETLIAITIITVGLVGVLGLVSYTISIGRVSSTEIIAANLAQEGIEVVRNIRDSNWVAGKDWDKKIEGEGNKKSARVSYNTVGPSIEYIHPSIGNPKACNVPPHADQCSLYLKDGFYSYDNTGDKTNFRRLVRIIKTTGKDKLKIRSMVAWKDRNDNWHQIRVEDHLYKYTMPSPPVKFRWELTDESKWKNCQWLKLEGEDEKCKITVGGEYKKKYKCGKCCQNAFPNCSNYYHIAPWDNSPSEKEPPEGISPELPAFLGDPDEVCDIYKNPTPPPDYKCRVFEKKEY